MNLKSKIEAVLFLSGKTLSFKKLAEILGEDKEKIKTAVQELQNDYQERGITIIEKGEKIQLTTSPQIAEVVRKFLKDERSGELTRPSLETLAIIAYRGPISKSDIELIRGINCSLILRNLMIRGLIEEKIERGISHYSLSFAMMKFLGIRKLEELPDYQRLNRDIKLGEILLEQKKEKDFFQDVE